LATIELFFASQPTARLMSRAASSPAGQRMKHRNVATGQNPHGFEPGGTKHSLRDRASQSVPIGVNRRQKT
jgi:hypothetical protein